MQIRAERRAGQFLGEMDKQDGGDAMRARFRAETEVPPKLENLGISKAASHRWQTIGRMPEDEKAKGLTYQLHRRSVMFPNFARAVRIEETAIEEYLDKLGKQHYKAMEELSDHEQRQETKTEEDVRADVKTSLELEEEADPENLQSLSDWFEEVSQLGFELNPTHPRREDCLPRPSEQVRIEEAAPPEEAPKFQPIAPKTKQSGQAGSARKRRCTVLDISSKRSRCYNLMAVS